MKKQIFDHILNLISRVTSKKVLYISSSPNPFDLAVRSKFGFWYCGNVFDQQDIAYGIASSGAVEPYDTEIVLQILKHLGTHYVFYDIGANTGWYTMIAHSLGKESTVHAFEPVSAHIKCLKETVSLNRMESRTVIHPLALSDKDGESDILLAGTGSSLEKDFLETSDGTEHIKIQKLDTYRNNLDLELPDFIKIDVEGHEWKVLTGAENLLRQAKPVLFIEVAYSLKKAGRNFIHQDYNKIFDFLKELGYDSYIVKNEKVALFSQKEKDDGVYMYLFLHKEKHNHIAKTF